MKSFAKHPEIFVLFFLIAVVFPACIDPYGEETHSYPPDFNLPITQEGGVFTAMNGNVVLTFPSGAVVQPVRFTVTECFDSYNCNFLLKAITIEPFMEFSKPVMLSLKYEGVLANGQKLSDGICPMAYNWGTSEIFANLPSEKCLTCCIDQVTKTVNVSITRTGSYGIGLNINESVIH